MLENIIAVFQSSPWLFYTSVIFTGLCVGSFLNVVAYRLPVIMERNWKAECYTFLELEPPAPDPAIQNLSLSFPASACPHCGHKIRFWENIPILSYVLLRGKCAACHTPISIQYPLVEALTAVLSGIVAWRFGPHWQTLAALLFSWVLIALTFIDLKKQLLPDNLTLPLLWAGLLFALFNLFTDLVSSVIGAMAGYIILWSVYQLFKLVTGKEGMGYGDFKLLAALGAWGGYQLLPQIILLSSIVGASMGILMIISGRSRTRQPIPFGPYLSIAGWIALLWGAQINQIYLTFLNP